MSFYAPQILIATSAASLASSPLRRARLRLLGEELVVLSEDGLTLMVADCGAPTGRQLKDKMPVIFEELIETAGSSGCEALICALGGDRGVFGVEAATFLAQEPLAEPMGLRAAKQAPRELIIAATHSGSSFEAQSQGLRRLQAEIGASLTLMESGAMGAGQVSLCARFDFRALDERAATAACATALIGAHEAMATPGSLGELSKEWVASARYKSGWACVGSSGEWSAQAPWVKEIYAVLKSAQPARRILSAARPMR